eukprot:1153268-Pelagomonas_calceolata.AAC.4
MALQARLVLVIILPILLCVIWSAVFCVKRLRKASGRTLFGQVKPPMEGPDSTLVVRWAASAWPHHARHGIEEWKRKMESMLLAAILPDCGQTVVDERTASSSQGRPPCG